MYNKRTLVIKESMHVVIYEFNNSYLRKSINNDKDQTKTKKWIGTNEQAWTNNLISLVKQGGWSFKLEDEENELLSIEHQNNKTPM